MKQPVIVATTRSYRILMVVTGQPPEQPIYHDVSVHSTGIHTLQEVIQKEHGCILLHQTMSHSWEEFRDKHPDDAQLIVDYENSNQ